MAIIDSLSVPDALPSGKRRFAEERLEAIRRDNHSLAREIERKSVDPEYSRSDVLSYAQCILNSLRKVERLVPEMISADFIESWLRETEHRLKPFGTHH